MALFSQRWHVGRNDATTIIFRSGLVQLHVFCRESGSSGRFRCLPGSAKTRDTSVDPWSRVVSKSHRVCPSYARLGVGPYQRHPCHGED